MTAGKHSPDSLYRWLLSIGLHAASGEHHVLDSDRLRYMAVATYWQRRSVPLRAYDEAAQRAALNSEGVVGGKGKPPAAPSAKRGAA